MLVSRFSLLQQPSSARAVEQLGIATIDPTHFDRPAPSLIADFEQVHAVRKGQLANMVNIARISTLAP